jgi:AraC-like DNA-binding protein
MDKTEGYDAGADSYLTKPFSVQLLKSRIQNLFDSRASLARQILSSYTGQQILPPNALSNLDNELLQKITTLIRENSYAGTVDIEFIAHNVCMSHSSLYRKIKALTGLSINEYIRKVKMNYAGELLLSGRHTVSEVAFQTGINSITYFRQCFKEEFGTTPSQYAKKKS